jgi:hypothetical protein
LVDRHGGAHHCEFQVKEFPRRQISVSKAAAQFGGSGRKNISSFLYDVEDLSVLFDHVEKQLRHRDAAVDR